MLSAIAFLPLLWNHHWEKNRVKLLIAGILSFPAAIFLFRNGLENRLIHAILFDYLPFIILLGSLYIITGGIYLSDNIEGSPGINTFLLASGALLASVLGTTGASMLLVRPLIRTNKRRKEKAHTILFLIAIAANCGGLLSPIGDPPLFMLYLRGVPFAWFLDLIPQWLFINGSLLVVYYLIDSYYYRKERIGNTHEKKRKNEPIKIEGGLNFLWLAGVIISVAYINGQYPCFLKNGGYFTFLREIVILLMALLSFLFTSNRIRTLNNFSWGPIEEISSLFLGIFITMIPCLLYIEKNAAALGIVSPRAFFYSAGFLTSFLDNTPTAVVFYSLARGLSFVSPGAIAGIPVLLLKAISLGSVLFGSMTYIGNAPNFLIKSIAEENDINMPHFFGYLIKFSLIILLPLFILMQFLFFKI
jgi:Na+/H+ antiporter NhaD/arsenite permease-like protein